MPMWVARTAPPDNQRRNPRMEQAAGGGEMNSDWYWVKWIDGSSWEVAEFDADGMWWCGREIAVHGPEVIGPRIEEPARLEGEQ